MCIGSSVFLGKQNKSNLVSLLVLIAGLIFFFSNNIIPCIYFEVFLFNLYHFRAHSLVFQNLLQESFSLAPCT